MIPEYLNWLYKNQDNKLIKKKDVVDKFDHSHKINIDRLRFFYIPLDLRFFEYMYGGLQGPLPYELFKYTKFLGGVRDGYRYYYWYKNKLFNEPITSCYRVITENGFSELANRYINGNIVVRIMKTNQRAIDWVLKCEFKELL